MGRCFTPFTILGCGSFAASSTVGATSTTWWNWLRISPLALMPLGQWSTMPLRVPPKWLATCLVHWKGVLPAQAQPMAKCGKVVGSPHASMWPIIWSALPMMPLSAIISL